MTKDKRAVKSRPFFEDTVIEEIDFDKALDEFFEGGCTPEQRKKCEASSGAFIDAICAACPKHSWRPSYYVTMIHEIYMLQLAGIVFEDYLLDEQFWFDLGRYKLEIENRRMRF